MMPYRSKQIPDRQLLSDWLYLLHAEKQVSYVQASLFFFIHVLLYFV